MTTARGEALWTRFCWQRGQDTDPRELGYERTRRATAVRLISPDQPRFRRPVRVTMSGLFAAISARPVPKSVPNTATASRMDECAVVSGRPRDHAVRRPGRRTIRRDGTRVGQPQERIPADHPASGDPAWA